jgi:hypothetical protein
MGFLSDLVLNVYIFTYDFFLFFLNLILPKRRIGHVVPPGAPGEGGKWPEFIPPKEGDSRCACPALNAMANHGNQSIPSLYPGPFLMHGFLYLPGIFPRDGKNISFIEMNQKIQQTYNFAPTFTRYVPNVMAGLLNKSYAKDRLDLAEINLHNGIEHDASLTREIRFLKHVDRLSSLVC